MHAVPHVAVLSSLLGLGTIDASELGVAIKALGFEPSQDEIDKMLKVCTRPFPASSSSFCSAGAAVSTET